MQTLSKWEVSRVTSTFTMFYQAEPFTGTGVEQWNITQVLDMSYMFNGAKMLNAILSNWSVSQVEKIDHMFCGTNVSAQDISSWTIAADVLACL
jgi:hypothetical protein